MMKPQRLAYLELISQLQNFDQYRSWFSSHINMTNTQFTYQLAFYRQQQQQRNKHRTHQPSLAHINFNLMGEGFQPNNLEIKT